MQFERVPTVTTKIQDANKIPYHQNFKGIDIYVSPAITNADGRRIIQLDRAVAGRDLADLQDDYTSTVASLEARWQAETQTTNTRIDNLLRGLPKSYTVAGYFDSLAAFRAAAADAATNLITRYPDPQPPFAGQVWVNDVANPANSGLYDLATRTRIYEDLDAYIPGTTIYNDNNNRTYKVNDEATVDADGDIVSLLAAPFGYYEAANFLGALRIGGDSGRDVTLETTARFIQVAGGDGIVRLGISPEFQAELIGLRNDINGNSQSIIALTTRVAGDEEIIQRQGAMIQAQGTAIGNLQQADRDLILSLQQTNDNVTAAVNQERTDVTNINTSLDQLTGVVRGQGIQIAEDQNNIQTLTGRVNGLATTQGEMQQEDIDLQNQIDSINLLLPQKDTPADRDRAIALDAQEILLKEGDPNIVRTEVNGATVWRVTFPQAGFGVVSYLEVPSEGTTARRRVLQLLKLFIENTVVEMWEEGLVAWGSRSIRVKRFYPVNF